MKYTIYKTKTKITYDTVLAVCSVCAGMYSYSISISIIMLIHPILQIKSWLTEHEDYVQYDVVNPRSVRSQIAT